MMTPEQLNAEYAKYRRRLEQLCVGLGRRRKATTEDIEDYQNEAWILLVKAGATYDPDKGAWERWLMITVQNGLQDLSRANNRPALHGEYLPGVVDRRRPVECLLGLSKDAVDLALTVVAEFNGGPRYALDRAKEQMFALIGWRRYWAALEELKAALVVGE